MAIQRVDQVQAGTAAERAEAVQVQRRLALFSATTFERSTAVKGSDGSRINVPGLGEEDRARAAVLFGKVPAEKQEALQAATDNLAAAIYAEGKTNAAGIESGSFSPGLQAALGAAVGQFCAATSTEKSDEAIQGGMYMGIIGLEQELKAFAKKVSDKNALSDELRVDIAELTDALEDWPNPDEKREFTYTEYTINEDGSVTRTEKTEMLNKEEAENKVKELEDARESLRSMTELEMYDLQQMNQDYNQALNTLSGLLKSEHESLKAIIANLKA